MKLLAPFLSLVLAVGVLPGCSTTGQGEQEYQPQQGGPGYGPTTPAGDEAVPGSPAPMPPPGQGSSGMSMGERTGSGSNDQLAMCELHRRMMAARTPEERQALMEQTMPGMSPDMRERHLQMMREHCQ